MAIERNKELRRRRKRRAKYDKFKKKLDKATVSERKVIAVKLRGMTSGAEVLIAAWGLEERKN